MRGGTKRLILAGFGLVCIISIVLFEYDAHKSAINFQKHGVGFEKAQELWAGKTVEAPARSDRELRLLLVGKLDGRCWTAIFTNRLGRIRIISVRRSTKNEIAFYNSH